MQDQGSAGGSMLPEREDTAAVVLDILSGEHPALLDVSELVGVYARGSLKHEAARPIVEDALSELLASGLIHRLDRFVFVSRAARRAQALAS